MNETKNLLERVGDRYPLPEPAFERLKRRRDRKRRNQRIAAGSVGIAIFVAMVWILATGGPFHHTRTPAAPGPTVVPRTAVGLIGLAPEGATPSTPLRGELIVGFTFGHTDGDPGRFSLHIYQDGRVIWEKLGDVAAGDPTSTGLVEQHLTPEGVDLIRSEVLSTGLFHRNVHLIGAYLRHFGDVVVRDGDRLVRVTWGDIGSHDGETRMSTREQASALKRLDARLEDLALWLPASAWEDAEMKAYVPSKYALCFETGQDVGFQRVLGSLPRSAEDQLRALDLTYREDRSDPGLAKPWYVWCSTVTSGQARSLDAILEDAGVRSNGGDVFGLVFYADARAPDAVEVSVAFWPLLPDEP